MKRLMGYIKVKAWPGFAKEKISRLAEDRFEIWMREDAHMGQANARVLVILAKELNVPKSQIRMINGHKKQSKLFYVNDGEKK